MLKPSELVRVENALGRVLSELSVGCPPAVPILVYGEVIDSSAILRFKYYGIDEVRVIKG
jgi:arginine/lysine/ornithine decarboxylase